MLPPQLRLKSYNYYLPPELIAQSPAKPRDHSRLLILDRKKNKIIHDHFYNLPQYLTKGDVLVFNNSKVIPARLYGKKETGGKIEVFLLRKIKNNIWQCLTKGKIKEQQKIILPKNFIGQIIKINDDGTKIIKFISENPRVKPGGFLNILSIGQTPTPPYIKKKSNLIEYQTVYAKKEGSVAAPTAGFHFTKSLLTKLKKKGVQLEYVTLHVGLGTFLPVKENDITKHQMHTEYFSISKNTLVRIKKAKKAKRRIIAVGTTSCRTLESANCHGATNIFIYPGYKFKNIDAMITNFHLPKSTLLMLVSALAGRSKIKKAYQEAVQNKYRFYSFGDAMLIK